MLEIEKEKLEERGKVVSEEERREFLEKELGLIIQFCRTTRPLYLFYYILLLYKTTP